jgi:hypothetical protein
LNTAKALEAAQMSRIQSEAIVGALHDSISESQTRVTDLFASKAELLAIKSELGERVFNSQLKFDVSQRHQRELAEKELQNLKSELRSLERADVAELLSAVHDLEKKMLEQQAHSDSKVEGLRSAMTELELRMLRVTIAGVASFAGLGLAVARIMM